MTDLGKIGYVLKGDYDATASYEYLDVVYYNGSTYAAKKNVTGVAPTTGRSDDLNWQIMVNPAAGLIRPLGTITFAELPESPTSGDSYDISNSFTTDNRFKEGAGKKYPGGVNVYYTADGYWDILAGKPIVSAINGMKIDGTDNVNNYGVCSTAGATVAKTVSITGNFLLVSGAEVDVKFANNNTATAPTLNVNNTGAKPIYYAGDAIEARNIMAGMVYSFRYNGTQWDLVGGVNSGHVIEDEDGTDYSNRTNLVFENAEVTDDPTHDATVVRPNGDKSHVFDTLEEANEALADGLLKDGDVVYIKQGPGEVNISRLVTRIGLVEDNKQDKTLSSPIAGQTTVEEALATIYANTPRFVNFSAGATSRPTSGWVATEDCYLVYSIGYVKNQVDTALNIDGNQVARITTDTGSASLQGSMFIKKGQRITLGGYSPTGSLSTYPLL